ncbi:CdaR family transcriptional regulator [Salinicoccus luteus]|uniref:CdaR family transcriptional regulator n=1 Tax=Salinicoccus luteus TaxID=367840 RepID=UPI00146FAA15|nr:sugar diacid recognition domain-containing protein [Salinicoccus luteus]
MLIPREIAQSIVEETGSIMKRDIHFTDEEARIIASMDAGRVGDFHEGAAEVLRTEQKVVVYSRKTLEGTRPGVIMPVRLHDQVVGVIGITGDPGEVGRLGVLLQRMTQILVREAYKEGYLEEQLELENQARETFVKEWADNSFDDEKLFATRGWIFNINIYKARVAVILELEGFEDYWYARIGSPDADVLEEVRLQRYRRAIENLISRHFPEKNEHVLVPNGTSSYMLLLSVNEHMDYQQRKKLLTSRMEEIQSALDKTYDQRSVAGIGNLYDSPRELWKSVEEADRALRFGVDHKRPLFYFEDLGVESFMYDLSQSVRTDFIQRKLRPELLAAIPDCFNTIDTFYKNDGSIKKTAESLHIHKNTLQYRLKKVKEVTGYDPRDINDSTLLQIALAFYKIT